MHARWGFRCSVAAALLAACTEEPTLSELGGRPPLVTEVEGGAPAPPGVSDGAPLCTPWTDPSAALPCDVAAILEAKCRRCHDAADALADCLDAEACIQGPFPLRSLADVLEPYGDRPVHEVMRDAVGSGFMPFTAVVLEPPVAALDDDERTLLLEWLACVVPGPPDEDCTAGGR